MGAPRRWFSCVNSGKRFGLSASALALTALVAGGLVVAARGAPVPGGLSQTTTTTSSASGAAPQGQQLLNDPSVSTIAPICGDQDGSETPLVYNCSQFSRSVDRRYYQVPGSGSVTVHFDYVYREAACNNELAVFRVDDTSGSINGVLPGNSSWPTQVASRNPQVAFGFGTSAGSQDVNLTFQGGDILALRFHACGSYSFYSFEQANQDGYDHLLAFQHAAGQPWQFAWEDGGVGGFGGGDQDFNDMMVNVSAPIGSSGPPPEQTFGPNVCRSGHGIHGRSGTRCLSDPVNSLTGAFVDAESDVSLAESGLPFEFTRSYTSADTTVGRLGPGWTDGFSASLTVQGNGNVVLHGEDGQQLVYTRQADGSFVGAAGAGSTLSAVTGGYQLVTQDQVTYQFGGAGALQSMRDRNGQGLSFTYDGSARLSAVTDSAGRAMTLAYNASNLVSSVSAPGGQVVTYAYTGGRLTSVVDVRGKTWTYSYDAAGRLATIVDPLGNTQVSNTYDSSGRVTQQTDGAGKTTTFAWDAGTQTATVTDPNGKAWKDVYSGSLLAKRIDPLNNATQFGIDSADLNATSVAAPDGAKTTMTYDSRGNMLSTTAPASLGSAQKTFAYNARNDPTSITDARGKVTTYSYDGAGNRTSITQEGVTMATSTYDAAGRVLTSKDGNGNTTTYAYDAFGNTVSVTDALGNKTTYSYDAAGRMLTRTEPRGNVQGANPADFTWTYTYNTAGQVLTETDPLGNTTQHTYDDAGNEATVTDARGKVTTYGYDNANRLLSVTAPDGGVTRYAYDAAGNKASETDPLNHTTAYAYDGANQLVSTTTATGAKSTSVYDQNGDQIKSVDPRGNVPGANPDDYASTFTYDAAGHTLSETDPLGHSTTHVYDAVGNEASETDARGFITTYAYDGRNRLSSVTAGDGGVTRYTYDNAGNKLSETDPRQSTTTYAYDAGSRIVTVTRPDPDGPGPQGPAVTTYGYDANGNLVSTVDPRGNVPGCNCASQYTTTYGYDRANRRISETDPLGHTTTWTYDAAGNKLTQTDANNHQIAYGYDGVNRLVNVTAPGGAVTSYTYDLAGNVLTRTDANNHTTTYSYDADNRRTGVGTPLGGLWTQTYDPAGNVSTTVDANGNATGTAGDGTKAYAYDRAGRLIAIDYSDATPDVTFGYDAAGNRTSMSDGDGTQTRTYDALGRLTGVTRGADSFVYGYDAAGDVTRRTYPGGTSVDYTYDADGRMTAVTDQGLTTSYAYDPADELTQTALPSSNGYVETRAYDRAGRLVEVKNAKGSTVLADFQAAIDPVGNPTTITRTGSAPETRSYGYDSNDRLASVCFQAGSCPGAGDPFIRWTYDPVGNRVTETRPGRVSTYTYDAGDELTSTSSASSVASYPTQVQTDGAQPYWRFGETSGGTFSSSVGSYTGTWSGAPALGAAGALTGDTNKAVTLNGTSQYGTVADANQLDKTSSFSIELWVKRTKDKQTQAIAGKPLTTATADENYALWFDTANKIRFEVGAGHTVNKSAKLTSSTALDTNWHYVVGTFASGALKLYIDGSLSSSMTASGFTTAGANASTLDVGRAGTTSYYGGSLDELAVYGSALTAAQVSDHRSRGTTPPPSPTITNYTYDLNGNQTTIGYLPAEYDLANRLVALGEPPAPPCDGCVPSPMPIKDRCFTFRYDGDGHRTSVSNPAGCISAGINFVWDINGVMPEVALERDDGESLLRRYTYGARRISMSSGGGTFYYHYDTLGSVANVTSSTGAPKWTYSYEPFGTTRSATQNDTAAPVNPMQFAGEYLDWGGLYNLRAREYDPTLGRFTSTDPDAAAASEPSAASYTYVDDRPTVLVDPSGEHGTPASRYARGLAANAASPNAWACPPSRASQVYPWNSGFRAFAFLGAQAPSSRAVEKGGPIHRMDKGGPTGTYYYVKTWGRVYTTEFLPTGSPNACVLFGVRWDLSPLSSRDSVLLTLKYNWREIGTDKLSDERVFCNHTPAFVRHRVREGSPPCRGRLLLDTRQKRGAVESVDNVDYYGIDLDRYEPGRVSVVGDLHREGYGPLWAGGNFLFPKFAHVIECNLYRYVSPGCSVTTG